MLRILQCKCDIEDKRSVSQLAADWLRIPLSGIVRTTIHKRSVDARKKPDIFYVYSLDVTLADPASEKNILRRFAGKGVEKVALDTYHFPMSGHTVMNFRPVVVGAGPAGLFAAYCLARQGYRPIVLERGSDVDTRTEEVEKFWRDGQLNPQSNVQFGEGGAGTFSDGKLNTMIKDPSGRIRQVYQTFVDCGADPSVMYDSRPHIGTDCLRQVIKNLRGKILEAGGEIHFGCRMTDMKIEDGRLQGIVCAVRSSSDMKGETKDCSKAGEERSGERYCCIPCSVCVLATGHSARDTFEQLARLGVPMEAKNFAVGFRVEHPQSMIQDAQYGVRGSLLPAASYKLTAKAKSGRGVYSFCMCPGGMVVNASSEKGMLAVNGMSLHARDGRNANSAIVVTVQPEDCVRWIEDCNISRKRDMPEGSRQSETGRHYRFLCGMYFQRQIEQLAFRKAEGKIPVQLFGDYEKHCPSTGLGEVVPDMKGRWELSDVRDILPPELGDAIEEGIHSFGLRINGFDRPDALLSGVESRTSSPVRILRGEDMESSVTGLYPCGEGAGYAGGITSAAVDGIKVAEKIAAKYDRPSAQADTGTFF